jgi:hypothetical protein
MAEENKNEIAQTATEVPASTDAVIELSTEAVAEAERRIDAVKKIKNISLRITNYLDWVNEDGKPYLQGSGAEKVARLWGINFGIVDLKKEHLEGGHIRYVYTGYFTLKGARIEAVGIRASNQPFFAKRWDNEKKEHYMLDANMVDQANVQKSAFSNCIANGVTRILGIRNMTFEDLQEAGVEVEKIKGFTFKKKGKDKPKTNGPAANGKQDLNPFESLDDFRQVSQPRMVGVLLSLEKNLTTEQKEMLDKDFPIDYKDMNKDELCNVYPVIKSMLRSKGGEQQSLPVET